MHLNRSFALHPTSPAAGSKRKAAFPDAPQGWARQKLVRMDLDEGEELDDWTEDDEGHTTNDRDHERRTTYMIATPRRTSSNLRSPASLLTQQQQPLSLALKSDIRPHGQKHARFSTCGVCHRQQNLFAMAQSLSRCSVCDEMVCNVCSRSCDGSACRGSVVCGRCCVEGPDVTLCHSCSTSS